MVPCGLNYFAASKVISNYRHYYLSDLEVEKSGLLVERAYRGKKHPPYCTCAACTSNRHKRQNGGRLKGVLSRLKTMFRLRF